MSLTDLFSRRPDGALNAIVSALVPKGTPRHLAKLESLYAARSAAAGETQIPGAEVSPERRAELRVALACFDTLIARAELTARFDAAERQIQADREGAARALAATEKAMREAKSAHASAERDSADIAKRLKAQQEARDAQREKGEGAVAAAREALQAAVLSGNDAAEAKASIVLRGVIAENDDSGAALGLRCDALSRERVRRESAASECAASLERAGAEHSSAQAQAAAVEHDAAAGAFVAEFFKMVRTAEAIRARGHTTHETDLLQGAGTQSLWIHDTRRTWFAPVDPGRTAASVRPLNAVLELVRLADGPGPDLRALNCLQSLQR